MIARGSLSPGQRGGLVFVDAVGLGSGGAHLRDSATVEPGSAHRPCGSIEPCPFTGFDPRGISLPAINRNRPAGAMLTRAVAVVRSISVSTVLNMDDAACS